jgi:hypothetical protein
LREAAAHVPPTKVEQILMRAGEPPGEQSSDEVARALLVARSVASELVPYAVQKQKLMLLDVNGMPCVNSSNPLITGTLNCRNRFPPTLLLFMLDWFEVVPLHHTTPFSMRC